MEATTMRASTVSRSIPTRETRTQASMTMPLSRTRSRTSIRLVPPEALSTGMISSPLVLLDGLSPAPWPGRLRGRQRVDLGFEKTHLLAQGLVLDRKLVGCDGEVRIVPPPVQADLLRLVDRADQQADTDGDQLDLRQRDANVAGDDQSLVEDSVQNIDQAAGAAIGRFDR